MQVNVLLFAGYRETVGNSAVQIELVNESTVGDLTAEMASRYPGLPQESSRIVAAVNDEFRLHDFTLSNGDEVALIPPVSGGAPFTGDGPGAGAPPLVVVTDDTLDPADFTEPVRRGSSGAVVTFLGTTRDENAGRVVTLLEYEGYRPMADKMLARVADEMAERWELGGVAIGHRLGRVDIGEISLVIAVSAAHRAAAFEAVAYAVDRIKQIVPIWKKEHFEGGEVWIGSQDGKEFSPLGDSL
jgi:molybdopterin synthase catalytic subunit